jgi:hypothetical protein
MSKYPDLKIKYLKWIKERKMSDEINRIVKLLQERGGLSKEELKDLDGTVKKLRKEVAVPSRTEYKLILNERAATAVWANGFAVAFHLDGSVHVSMDGIPTEHTSITKLNIEFGALEACMKHIVGLHHKLAEEYTKSKCPTTQKTKEEEPKTRFLHSNNKRAFVAGMIFGRKNP